MVCCQTFILALWCFGIAVKGQANDWTAMILLHMGEFGFYSLVISRFILPVQVDVRDGRAV